MTTRIPPVIKFFSAFVLAAFIVAFFITQFAPLRSARAASATICASGCDYTTLTAANAGATNGDTLFIQATYDPSSETYPISLNKSNLTFDCQNSGAVIGLVTGGQRQVAIGSGSAIQNCAVVNMRINVFVNNVTIAGNTFSTSSAASIFLSNSTGFTISNNTGINDIYVNGTSGNGTISNNTFYLYWSGFTPNVPFLMGTAMTNTVFSNNTFHNYSTSFTTFVTGFGSDLSFNNNTFDFPINSTAAGTQHSILDLSGSNLTVTGNKMSFPTSDAGTKFLGVSILPTNANANTSVVVTNNTMKIPAGLNGSAAGPTGIWAGSNGTRSTAVTSSYNIIASTSTNPNSIGILLNKNAATTVTLVNDYNDFYNINTNLSLVGGATGSVGANTRTGDPYFAIKDVLTSNDFNLAPFSNFLSVNGTYIGADSGPRRTTLYLDPAGIIDYSAVDTTSTQEALNNLMSGDTLHLAAGSYSALIVASTSLATSSITITGVGAPSIINGSAGAHALTVQGLTNCSITNLQTQNAGTHFAGIKFATTTGCLVSNVTSTGNGYGFLFSTDALNNTVNDSIVTTSIDYDIQSVANGTNNFKNTLFTLASTSLSVGSTIGVYYKTRAFVRDETGLPVAGAQVTLTDGNASSSSLLITGTDGYSPLSSYLLAASLTTGNTSSTSGGYNPYTATVPATSSLLAYTKTFNLTTANDLFSITLALPAQHRSTAGFSGPLVSANEQPGSLVTPDAYTATNTVAQQAQTHVTSTPPNTEVPCISSSTCTDQHMLDEKNTTAPTTGALSEPEPPLMTSTVGTIKSAKSKKALVLKKISPENIQPPVLLEEPRESPRKFIQNQKNTTTTPVLSLVTSSLFISQNRTPRSPENQNDTSSLWAKLLHLLSSIAL